MYLCINISLHHINVNMTKSERSHWRSSQCETLLWSEKTSAPDLVAGSRAKIPRDGILHQRRHARDAFHEALAERLGNLRTSWVPS